MKKYEFRLEVIDKDYMDSLVVAFGGVVGVVLAIPVGSITAELQSEP